MGTVLSPESQRCGDGDEKRSMLSLYSVPAGVTEVFTGNAQRIP